MTQCEQYFELKTSYLLIALSAQIPPTRQLGPHSDQKIFLIKRFGDVVINAQRLAPTDIYLLPTRSKKEERDTDQLWSFLNLRMELISINIRHHNVGDNQIWSLLFKGIQRLPTVSRCHHPITRNFQQITDPLQQSQIILHN